MRALLAFAAGGVGSGLVIYTVVIVRLDSCHSLTAAPATPPAPEPRAGEAALRELRELRGKVAQLELDNAALVSRAREAAAPPPAAPRGAEPEAAGAGSAAAAAAVQFQPPRPGGRISAVGLAAVADRMHARKFDVSIASQRCYAERHGYEYTVLDPADYPACKQRDFFFRKHCTVARFLETKEPDYYLFVLDGDNPMVLLERNLDPWLEEARLTDVVLYERWMNNEIMAGNYAIRNSDWGIKFADGWAAYDRVDQPKGYHSSDNGAIHLHLLRWLRISKWTLCAYMWDNLRGNSMNLDEYFQFVSCTRLLMGAPRRWKLDGQYRVTILPRGHSWSVDGGTVNGKVSSVGPVSHHGQKTKDNYLKYFTDSFVEGQSRSCSTMVRPETWVEKDEYLKFMGRGIRERVAGGFHSMAHIAAPPWDRMYVDCMQTLSCRPLEYEAPLVVIEPAAEQRALPFIRIPEGARFQPCAKDGQMCTCTGVAKFGPAAENKKQSALAHVEADPGQIKCNIDTFGEDPAHGTAKSCFCYWSV